MDNKFAVDELTGRTLLTTDGCFQRHNISRDEQMMTGKETNRNYAEYEDQLIINYMAQGYRLLDNETNEEFLLRCKEDDPTIE